MAAGARVWKLVWKHCYPPRVLLAPRPGPRHWVGGSPLVLIGDAVGSVACGRTAVLSCGWPSILVARSPALSESRAVARMGHSPVSLRCEVTMRRAFGVSDVLWPSCLSALFVHASPVRYFRTRRPGVCGRADVGLGNVCLPGSCSRHHYRNALASKTFLESGGRLNMALEPSIAVLEVVPVARQHRTARPYAEVSDYWALTKPEINFLIAIATFAGFYLGLPTKLHAFPFMLLIHTLLGTLLVSSGASALNQYVERQFDAQMRRTARRSLAAGSIDPSSALSLGVLLSFAGAIDLALAVNSLASLLSGLTLESYLALYTPLKRKTPLC